MKKNETKLLASRAVNKIGNVMYDYGNSTWIAGLGSIGQKYMGYYQLAENVISLFLNPIGGAVADRFCKATRCYLFVKPKIFRFPYIPFLEIFL